MSFNLTNYILTSDILNHLDSKYTSFLNLDYNKVFIYSNFLDLPLCYKMGKITSDYFNLYERIHNEDTNLLIKNMVNYIKKNNYNKYHILLLYGTICNLMVYKYLYPLFINNKNINRDVRNYDQLFALRNNINPSKIRITKIFNKAFQLDFNDYDFIDSFMRETYSFFKSYEYFEYSIKKYRLALRIPYGLRGYFHIRDIFTNKKNVKHKVYMYKRHFKLNDSLLEQTNAMDESFITRYNDALKEASNKIEAINQNLFYKKEIDFTNLILK